jgi:hypothetical protein
MFTDEEKSEIQLVKLKIKTIVYLKLIDFDDDLNTLLFDKCIVSGGISASLFHNEEYNDVDMYFKTHKDINEFHHQMQSKNLWDDIQDVDPNYEMSNTKVANKVVTDNAYSFKSKMQLIVMAPFQDAHKSFDFVHALPYYDIATDKYYISKIQYECIKGKKLVGIENAIVKDKRIVKFKERGWTYTL